MYGILCKNDDKEIAKTLVDFFSIVVKTIKVMKDEFVTLFNHIVQWHIHIITTNFNISIVYKLVIDTTFQQIENQDSILQICKTCINKCINHIGVAKSLVYFFYFNQNIVSNFESSVFDSQFCSVHKQNIEIELYNIITA